MRTVELREVEARAELVTCPTCEATRGKSCTVKSGQRAPVPHKARIAIAPLARDVARCTDRRHGARCALPRGHAGAHHGESSTSILSWTSTGASVEPKPRPKKAKDPSVGPFAKRLLDGRAKEIRIALEVLGHTGVNVLVESVRGGSGWAFISDQQRAFAPLGKGVAEAIHNAQKHHSLVGCRVVDARGHACSKIDGHPGEHSNAAGWTTGADLHAGDDELLTAENAHRWWWGFRDPYGVIVAKLYSGNMQSVIETRAHPEIQSCGVIGPFMMPEGSSLEAATWAVRERLAAAAGALRCGKPSRHGAPCSLDAGHVERGQRHSNGEFTWALRGKEAAAATAPVANEHPRGQCPLLYVDPHTGAPYKPHLCCQREDGHEGPCGATLESGLDFEWRDTWDINPKRQKRNIAHAKRDHKEAGLMVEKTTKQSTSAEPRVEYDDPEHVVDDGKRCGVRDGKNGAACILEQGHGGTKLDPTPMHSTGYRTFRDKKPKASTTTTSEEPMTKTKSKIMTASDARAGTKEPAKPEKPVPLKHPPGRLFGHRRHAAGAIWPVIEGDEFDELVESIKGRGQDDDIVLVKVDDETFILDGWNRARACQEAKVKPRFTKYIGKVDIDSLLDYVDMKNDKRRHTTKSVRAMVAAAAVKLRRGTSGPVSRGTSSATPALTQKAAAKAKGVSDKYLRKAANIQEDGTPKLNEAVMRGRMSVKSAAQALGLTPSKQDELAELALSKEGELKPGRVQQLVNQEAKRAIVAKVNKEQVHPMPMGPFRVIRIDPPWPYDNSDQHEGSRGHMPYPPMSIAAICQMRGDIDKLVHEEGCILALDVPNAFIHEVGRVLEAWGFTHRTMRTWDKGRIGMGTWCRGQTEHLVIASRGMPVHTLNEVSTYVGAKAREHSRKPDQFADDLLKHCPGPHVELFAREAREGWATWGAETSKFDASQGAA